MNDQLELLLDFVRNASPEDLPGFIGRLEAVRATAWARLQAPTQAVQGHDSLITVGEAAQRLGVSKDYLYSHHGEYQFTRREGRKLLFSSQGIDRYCRQNRS